MRKAAEEKGGIAFPPRQAGTFPGEAEIFPGASDMAALMRSHDWGQTPFGPPETWPQSLRTAVSTILESTFAMVVAWGPEFRFFYNDRHRPVLGSTKHPRALGV